MAESAQGERTRMTTTHDVALLRIAAQRLAGPACATPEDAVGWMMAMQGQDLPGAITSVALRTAGRSRDDVVGAFDTGRVVRTWPMRGTLHVVAARALHWMVSLSSARPLVAMARRRTQLGLADEHVTRARNLLVAELAGGGARVRAEIMALWEAAGLQVTGGRGYHLLALLAHERVLCLGPLRGMEQAFVLVEDWIGISAPVERAEALARLAYGYLRSHGPATVHDLARWAGLSLTDVRAGIGAVADRLDRFDVDGDTYYLDPATPDLLREHLAAVCDVHLLPGFDELVLGYADRSMTVPAEHADRIVPGGNGVFRPTVVVDGVVRGTWRAARTGTRRHLETEPFTRWAPRVAAALPERFMALPG